MKLLLVLIILLLEEPTDTALPKKCFSNVKGYCRKKCEMGEAYEIACLNGKLCCVKEENNKYLDAQQLPPSPIQSDGEMDYIILSTTTLLTTQP
ncbi:beta-defensin 128 [Manis javanica]|uniref:beta-defensin 128 n=1 Tax=Manis javanica TaxID=9974 RepID=UPI000812D703|nr:beta-defensin 128 [Manis javanica]